MESKNKPAETNYNEYIDIILSGFIRQKVESLHDLIIPNEVKQLIADILIEIMRSFVLDTVSTDKNIISDNGTLFKVTNNIRGGFSAGDSNGRKTGRCIIKIVKLSPKNMVQIGITSDITNITKKGSANTSDMCYMNSGKTYYVWGSNKAGNGFEVGRRIHFSHSGWTDGDIVRMEWNESGDISYYTNDIFIGKIAVHKDLIYHPCVCRCTSEGDVELKIM